MHLLPVRKSAKKPLKGANDQRLHKRIYLDIQAWATFEGEPQTKVKTINISESGIGILSATFVLPKSICWVKLAMPVEGQPEKVFRVKAKIIHSVYSDKTKHFKMGLKFIAPQPHLITMIKALDN